MEAGPWTNGDGGGGDRSGFGYGGGECRTGSTDDRFVFFLRVGRRVKREGKGVFMCLRKYAHRMNYPLAPFASGGR